MFFNSPTVPNKIWDCICRRCASPKSPRVRHKMLLDFSCKNIVRQAAKAVVNESIPSDVIDLIRQGEQEEMFSDTLTYIIEAFEHKGKFVSVEELEGSFDSNFCSRFESIKGFHACRITNETSYRDYGLHVLDAERLLELALERFGSYTSAERIKEFLQVRGAHV